MRSAKLNKESTKVVKKATVSKNSAEVLDVAAVGWVLDQHNVTYNWQEKYNFLQNNGDIVGMGSIKKLDQRWKGKP